MTERKEAYRLMCCPWCGQEQPSLRKVGMYCQIHCLMCETAGPERVDPPSAAEAWNSLRKEDTERSCYNCSRSKTAECSRMISVYPCQAWSPKDISK